MTINGHFNTLVAARILGEKTDEMNESLIRLATGKRINSGKDDPAGLITAENLRATLEALDAETRALERSVHVTATADGALGEVSAMLSEAKALTVANENDFLSAEEKAANQMQIDSLMQSIDRLTSGASFNGQAIFDGSMSIEAAGESFDIAQVSTGALGLSDPNAKAIESAISSIASMRGELGAFARHSIGARLGSIQAEYENLASAHSRIVDTDFAAETSNLLRAQTLRLASLQAMTLTTAASGISIIA